MTLKEQIRVALGIDTPGTKLAYQDKLVDGTIITSEADELIEGSDVSVLTEDGTTIPLPVGEYETESGVKFSVVEEGVVAEIITEDEEAEVVEEAPVEEEVEAAREPKKIKESRELEFVSELSSAVKEMMSKMQSQIDDLRDIVEGKAVTSDEEIVNLSKQLAELEKAPGANPVQTSKFKKAPSVKVELTSNQYRALSSKEKFWYNINKN